MNEDRLPTDRELASWLDDTTIPLPHRVLWRLQDESEVRIGELLDLKVPDLALDDRTLHVAESKEGPKGISISEQVAAGLQQIVGTRRHGPVFLGPNGSRLTSSEAAETFWAVTGMSLHVLRHGRLARRLPSPLQRTVRVPPHPHPRELRIRRLVKGKATENGPLTGVLVKGPRLTRPL
ncbi:MULTISPECIES: tyrosine-type recombinase/integrase [Streptomyces]|uniref:tyrosine-type recombinase/integrase n=1 Tax=Streptomyces TaxID=1883 RepID=UPI00345C6050